MRLIPFDRRRAKTVAGWVRSSAEASNWCGKAEFPFQAATVASWSTENDVTAYLLVDAAGRPVAYGEVWSDDEEDEAELARLIVDPDRRGRGVGRALVTALVAVAGFDNILMRVVPHNDPALACYRSAGFVDVDPALAETWNEPQPVKYVWLRYERK
jgi:ribosomal protein S18 acetylase RimI-like enzyme